ncbi:MAG: TlpA disulfide reductase family protein [Phycisphaerales bacterium]|nr:TlpA disulfide reductase family protein [Phycisphaerales bacterium]
MSVQARPIQGMLAAMFVFVAAGIAEAAPKLQVGDAAPAFGDVTWVLPAEGVDVDMSDGKVHIVEFWTTSCRYCKLSIPHLSRLQQEWGIERLQIIGVTEEEEDKVKPWVDRNMPQLKYSIAISSNRGPQRTWFKAAKLEGVPQAFIVGPRGRIQFIGHPADPSFDMTLTKVMKGRFDAAKQRQAESLFEDLRRNKERKNWRQYEKTAKEIIAISPKVFIDTQIDLFETQLVQMRNPEAAYEGATAFVEARIDSDPEGVLFLVDRIVDDPDIPDEQRRLDFALDVATRILDRFEKPREQALALKTIAALHFRKGDVVEAAKTAKKAYQWAPAGVKDDYRAQWMAYKQHDKG